MIGLKPDIKFEGMNNFATTAKGQFISKCLFWVYQFPPKNERKQVNLRFHSSKVEFIRSFFGENVGSKKSF